MGLSQNWITEKVIDFEYKKYVLLAFLQEVSENFDVNKLYPHLSELITHYKQVVAIKENKQNLFNTFPHKISGMDFEKFRISYEKIIEDSTLMEEIENIINFSIPQLEQSLAEGKKIYDYLEEQIRISPVGLMPIYPEHGYMFINDTSDTKVYEYKITIFEQSDVKYRGIHTDFVKTYAKNLSNTFESIKNALIKENKNIPNPATFAIECELNIPFEESLFPIAKRSLVKYVSSIS